MSIIYVKKVRVEPHICQARGLVRPSQNFRHPFVNAPRGIEERWRVTFTNGEIIKEVVNLADEYNPYYNITKSETYYHIGSSAVYHNFLTIVDSTSVIYPPNVPQFP